MTEKPDAAPPLRYELVGHVAVLTFDRPDRRNALDTVMLEALVAALDRAESDDRVRAAVLTGGTRLFASGADIRELRATTPAQYLRSPRQAAYVRCARFPKPLVAAVAGYVLGGGCELALMCDLVIAGDNAVLGQPEIRLGIIPGAGGTQRWTRTTGRYRTTPVVLGAQTVSAWQAYDLGLVGQVVPAERVVTAAVAQARRLSRFSPTATRLAKAAVNAAEEAPLAAALDLERAYLTTLLSTADHFEGIDAFLEKRPADFTGE